MILKDYIVKIVSMKILQTDWFNFAVSITYTKKTINIF